MVGVPLVVSGATHPKETVLPVIPRVVDPVAVGYVPTMDSSFWFAALKFQVETLWDVPDPAAPASPPVVRQATRTAEPAATGSGRLRAKEWRRAEPDHMPLHQAQADPKAKGKPEFH